MEDLFIIQIFRIREMAVKKTSGKDPAHPADSVGRFGRFPEGRVIHLSIR